MKNLLLVDGSNLLFQMFYGMPTRIAGKDGKPIHGVLGFLGALLKIVRTLRPTHLLVVFDGEHHNDRTDIDPDYKANRPDFSAIPEEETPFSQLPDIYAALDHLKIKRMETTVCETDDLIASYALRYGKQTEIVIASLDSDFFQLINENVRILRYRGDNTILCDKGYIQEKFGIPPCQYADLKALTGDKSDNIKGASKIGPKNAAALLKEFDDLRGILEHVDQIKKPSVRASIAEASETLLKNQSLITLNDKAELPFSIEELSFRYNGERTTDVLTAIGLK